MKEHPILFTGAMVRAILDGAKTQTRRVVISSKRGIFDEDKVQRGYIDRDGCAQFVTRGAGTDDESGFWVPPRYGEPGDRLWVRESWQVHRDFDVLPPKLVAAALGGDVEGCIEYKATPRERGQEYFGKLRPSIHMPRWASRITLEVTEVRVQRVQEIDAYDSCCEGALRVDTDSVRPGYMAAAKAATDAREKPPLGPGPRERFQWLWESINAKRGFGWDVNPYVWAVTFKRVQP